MAWWTGKAQKTRPEPGLVASCCDFDMRLAHGRGLPTQIDYVYGDGIHLTVAHKREWSYGFKPDNKT
ncbi:hypothetical protein ACK3YJ_17265, partial [Aeromonas caviae]